MGFPPGSTRPWDDRIKDVALGLSIGAWSIGAAMSERDLLVRGTVAALHLTVAGLFLTRGRALHRGSLRAVAAALPSATLAGFVLKSAPATWPMWTQLLFAGSGALAIASLLCLGASFAVFPARRTLVTRGPYRVVRHPAYLAESVMITSAAVAVGPWWLPPTTLTTIVLTAALRIEAEERLLREDPAWAAYAETVRYRLLPGLW